MHPCKAISNKFLHFHPPPRLFTASHKSWINPYCFITYCSWPCKVISSCISVLSNCHKLTFFSYFCNFTDENYKLKILLGYLKCIKGRWATIFFGLNIWLGQRDNVHYWLFIGTTEPLVKIYIAMATYASVYIVATI